MERQIGRGSARSDRLTFADTRNDTTVYENDLHLGRFVKRDWGSKNDDAKNKEERVE